MNSAEVIDQLYRDGVKIIPTGNGLRVVAPKGYMTPERLDALKGLKKQIIEYLTEKPAFVWKVKVDNKTISIIDPQRSTHEEIQKGCHMRFGKDRVKSIHLHFGRDRIIEPQPTPR